jgi:hypothetical protein
MAKVLSFSEYTGINENENISGQFPQAASTILNVFFTTYGEIVSKIGEYKEAMNDLRSLEREKELDGKGKKMQEIIIKVSKLIKDPYTGLQSDFSSLGKLIYSTWKNLIEDEKAAKESSKIQSAIELNIDSYIENLISSAKEKNKNISKDGEKVDESINTEEIGGVLLIERVVWKEREQAASDLTTFKSQLETAIKSQRGVEATKDFRDLCKETLNKVNIFLSDLSDDKFQSLKRLQKKEKLDEILETVAKLKDEFHNAQHKALDQVGLESRIRKSIVDLISKSKEITAKVEKIKLEETERGEEDKDKDSDNEDEEVGENTPVNSSDFKELKVGGENSSKNGKNREAVKSFQVLYNTINPSKKIGEDGLFGRADKKRGQTEDAIVYTAKLIGSLLNKPEILEATKNGTILTPELQALTKIFVEKTIPEMKKKMESTKTEKTEKSEKPEEKKEKK